MVDFWFQLDRYYTFERDDKFCVGYFWKGSNFQNTKEFETQEARAEFVKEELPNFRPFKPQ